MKLIVYNCVIVYTCVITVICFYELCEELLYIIPLKVPGFCHIKFIQMSNSTLYNPKQPKPESSKQTKLPMQCLPRYLGASEYIDFRASFCAPEGGAVKTSLDYIAESCLQPPSATLAFRLFVLSTIYTLHSLYTLFSSLYQLYSTLHQLYSTLYKLYFTLPLYTVLYTIYTILYNIYIYCTLLSTLYAVLSTI